MTLVGRQLGAYEVIAKLGEGGMGEVYKARDTRLDRAVALKVIQPAVAASPEMRERFEREARAISALDHPHICTLYDVAREGDVSFLVMQYLEGESLADRLARSGKPASDPNKPPSGETNITTLSKGPITFDTALRYAAEIAHALDAAHRRGIVHRDLKPGNVMLTKTGTKLLDFGLAKLKGDDSGGIFGDATRTSPLTSQGAILGTLHYMSPEQLEGRDVDARSDIHAFGALLYEMLSGRRAFEGQSQAGVIAAIIGSDPQPIAALADPRTSLPVVARRALDRLLTRCLAKNPEDRWQSAGDLAAELNWIAEERLRAAPETASGTVTTVAAPPRSRERVLIATAAALALALGVVGYLWYPRAAPRPAPVTFTIEPPAGQTLANGPGLLALSREGSKVAFVTGQSPASQLWVRSLDALDPVRLDRAEAPWQPAWSPDGRAIAFAGIGGSVPVRRIDVTGGVPRQVAQAALGRVAWSPAGVLLFTGNDNRLYRAPDDGGPAQLAIDLDPARREISLDWPLFLPDGKRFVFLAHSAEVENNAIFLASLDSPARTFLLNALSNVEYSHGYLFYQRDGTMMARPFDAGSGRLTGDEFPVIEQVMFNAGNGRAAMALSESGTLAYVGGGGVNFSEGRSLVVVDRAGTIAQTVGPGRYASAAISPDGRQAIVAQDENQSSKRKLHLVDLERGIATRFTTADVDERSAVWARDGSFIAFHSRRDKESGIYRRGAGGGATTDELLWQTDDAVVPSGFSRDSQRLLFTRGAGPAQRIWMLPLSGDRTPVQAFPGSTVAQLLAAFSPDDKWIAYQEGRTPSATENQIYVQPFPPDGRRVQISTAGGRNPQWSHDGRQILYRAPDDSIMAVTLTADGGTIRPSTPRPAFGKPLPPVIALSATGDARGERFLLIRPPEKSVTEVAAITVVVNFAQSLQKK